MKYLSILLAVVILLSGCALARQEADETEHWDDQYVHSLQAENIRQGIEMEDFEENLDLQYVKWEYSGLQYGPKKQDGKGWETWVDSCNLTETGKEEPDSHKMMGHLVIQSMEEYNALISAIEQKKQCVTNQIGNYEDIYIPVDTMEVTIDESFFEKNNLVVADYCGVDSAFVCSRLDEVDPGFWGSEVTVVISKSQVYGGTEDRLGMIYWIPVPKRCTEAKIIYKETAWN